MLTTYKQYHLPPLSQQDISVLNQKHETRIEDINELRKHAKKAITASIDRVQKLSDDAKADINKSYQECRKQLDLIDKRFESHRVNPTYTADKLQEMYADRSPYVKTYTEEHERCLQLKTEHQQNKTELEKDLTPIKPLTTSNN